MEKSLDQLKGLIPVFAVIMAIAGFYYTTQHRLDHIEEEIKELQDEDSRIKKSIKRKNK
jgi:Na+/melibiose symporter-like transporter